MNGARRSFLLGSAASAMGAAIPDIVLAMLQRGGERTFTPEMFGARGDGRTNDSAAMARVSEAVSANGGGTVVFRRATYLVGAQSASGPRIGSGRRCRGSLAGGGNR